MHAAKLECILHSCWQEKIDALIVSIKTEIDNKNAFTIWEDLSKSFLLEGIDTILLACTDLNVIFRQEATPFQIIDSSTCLAHAIVNKWKELER